MERLSDVVTQAVIDLFMETNSGEEIHGSKLRQIVVHNGMSPWPGATLIGKLVKADIIRVARESVTDARGRTWRHYYTRGTLELPVIKPRVDTSEVERKAKGNPGRWVRLPAGVVGERALVELENKGFEVAVMVRCPVEDSSEGEI